MTKNTEQQVWVAFDTSEEHRYLHGVFLSKESFLDSIRSLGIIDLEIDYESDKYIEVSEGHYCFYNATRYLMSELK